MIIATALSLVGLGFLAWLLFSLAIYALPAFAGVSAGMFVYDAGAGPIGAIVVGLIAGVLTLVLGQTLFAVIRTPILRALIALVYSAPAALAGYHLVHAISAIGAPSEIWRQFFGMIGAVVIAGIAWARVSAFRPGRSVEADKRPPLGGAADDGLSRQAPSLG